MRGTYYPDNHKPSVVSSPKTVAFKADAEAIVAAIAHRVLLQDLDYHGLPELETYYPALQGLTEQQIRAAIAEVLS